jgi:hypothetical protein
MIDGEENSAERAAGYRLLAAEAEACAAKSMFPEMKASYLNVAKTWRTLASEAEDWAERLRPRQ